MDTAHLIEQVVATAHDVHRALRGRRLATAFEPGLLAGLAARGVACRAGDRAPVEYRGGGRTTGYQVGLTVGRTAETVAVELKVLDGLHAADDDQMLNGLRLGDWSRGAVNLNLMASNRGVRCDVFDLRHRGPNRTPTPAHAAQPGRRAA